MNTLTSKRFWLDALERAVKTAAQTFVGVASASTVGDWGTSWRQWLAGAGVAALLSVLTSIASVGQTNSITPASLVPPV